MIHTLTIDRVVPWSDYNEYEAQLEGRLDGHAVVGHTLLFGEEWDLVGPGKTLNVGVKFVRYGPVTVVGASEPVALRHDRGVEYVLVGTILEIDGELLKLDAGLVLTVDLDLAPQVSIPELAVGDRILVAGQLEFDVDPDD